MKICPPPSDDLGRFVDTEMAEMNYMPSMKEVLDALREERLGRAITFVYKQKNSIQHLLPQSIPQPPEEKNADHIGHILPLNKEETHHMVIFPDGTMLVVQPDTTAQSGIKNYQSHFKSSVDDLEYFESHGFTRNEIPGHLMRNIVSRSATIERTNDTLEQAKPMDDLLKQSVEIARLIRAENIQARMQNAATFVRLYGRPKPPGEPPSSDTPQPPAEPPGQPPPASLPPAS